MTRQRKSTDPSTHPLNVSYLVVGLVFLGLAGSWALRVTGIIDAEDVRWLLPLVLVASGLVGLAAFAAKSLSRGRHREQGYDDSQDDYDPYDPFHLESTQHDVTSDETTLLGRRTDDEGDLR